MNRHELSGARRERKEKDAGEQRADRKASADNKSKSAQAKGYATAGTAVIR
jgi:hypothetical protein